MVFPFERKSCRVRNVESVDGQLDQLRLLDIIAEDFMFMGAGLEKQRFDFPRCVHQPPRVLNLVARGTVGIRNFR